VRRHCWRCGEVLEHGPPVVCGRCGQAHYDNPQPCGGALVERDGRVLLVRRALEPWHGHWDIPGGFCDAAEHPIHAAERELREETGLHGRARAFVGMWLDSYGDPLPDGAPVMTLNAYYLVDLLDDRPVELDPAEATAADWFSLDDPPAELAFPGHARAVLTAARQLIATPGPPPPLLDRPA